MTKSHRIVSAFLVACAVFVGACNEPAPVAAPAPPPPQPAVAGVPPISEAQMAKVKAVFNEAEHIAQQGDQFRAEGERIEAADGREAANDTLLKARRKYVEALEMTEEFIEPELGPFTQEQVDKYLRMYTNQRARWAKANAMGKLHD